MDIPPIHVCNALSEKNEVLQQKYSKLTRKYKELEKQMLDVQEKFTRLQIEKKENSSMSAPPNLRKPVRLKLEPSPVKDRKDVTIEKLLVTHNNLLRQFEKETKQNNNNLKKIRKLEAENEKLQDNLFNGNQQVDFLTKQLSHKEEQLQIAVSQVKEKRKEPDNLSSLKKQYQKLEFQNRKLKDELKGLDNSFFEEIEDLKYALQQSAKLNTEYEKAIKRLCKQFGVNYDSNFAFLPSRKKRTKNTMQK